MQQLVEKARSGDADALETLMVAVQDKIYGLALRMLWHPEEARDATQEILIRIVTHLSDFRGESAFASWCYAIAANYLRTAAKSRIERQNYTFDRFADDLRDGASEPSDDERQRPDYRLLLEEIKVGCTLGMLLCLDREHRLAYILGEILELDSPEAAAILDISATAFRKRLSRARRQIIAFASSTCGVIDPANPCHCSRRLAAAVGNGRVVPGRPMFPVSAEAFEAAAREVQKIEKARRLAAVYRRHPKFVAANELRSRIRSLVKGL